MNRDDNFTLRMNSVERQLITVVAQRLERTESDTVRYLLREKARELGIAPATPKDDRHVAQPAT
jgi:hypothetical protein